MIEQLFEKYPVDINQIRHQLKIKAAELDLPFSQPVKTYNSRLAQELGLWAESKMKGDAFHRAAFRAYFVEGKNIARKPILIDIAASVDLPAREAEAVISERTFKAAVDEHWAISRKMSITAAPTFVINEDRLIGAHPYEMLKKLLEKNKVKKRTPTTRNKIISLHAARQRDRK